jgi:AbrB family looped-hinge helix DNA binding protein
MITITVQQRGVITLPKRVRDTLSITEGEVLAVRTEGNALVLEPHRAGDDAVLADIRASMEELKRGKFIEFGSIEELHKKARVRHAD